ncbi:MAG: Si-specific NAD(P)(+) transhydrogenase, partial [Candidatus Poribacteria bacterium]|nr:Si-specific NAD(P)(+) transhydrogenase [Candidatus Poribacteria bacterium]
NTGTIPSKTLREAVMRLSGYRDRDMYGMSYAVKENITMEDLGFRVDHVVRHETDIMRHQLQRAGVEFIGADCSFVDPYTIRANIMGQHGFRDLSAPKIIVAVGSVTTQDDHIPFDGNCVFTSDDILNIDELPRTLAVVGAGVIGLEYACIFAALGVRVTVIDKRKDLLSFVDSEIMDSLVHLMRQDRTTFRLGEAIAGIEPFYDRQRERNRVLMHTESGKLIIADKALYSIGRTGATTTLNLPAAGLQADSRGRLTVNEHYQTAAPHIYAVGDVIGFPALASTSMEQGRSAACHAFGGEAPLGGDIFPYGIYTIPEIAMVGKTEQELTAAMIPYEVGKSYYREIARGQILGDSTGLLKLLIHRETLELLGVHILGEGATELVHIGQALMSYKGTVDYFVQTVFNYPTLAECYKTAAFDGLSRI